MCKSKARGGRTQLSPYVGIGQNKGNLELSQHPCRDQEYKGAGGGHCTTVVWDGMPCGTTGHLWCPQLFPYFVCHCQHPLKYFYYLYNNYYYSITKWRPIGSLYFRVSRSTVEHVLFHYNQSRKGINHE